MVAQDTGGAIKGPIRGDVFWDPENSRAVSWNNEGKRKYVCFLPKSINPNFISR